MAKNMSLLTCKLANSDESSTVVHIGGTRLLIALKYLPIVITLQNILFIVIYLAHNLKDATSVMKRCCYFSTIGEIKTCKFTQKCSSKATSANVFDIKIPL